MDELQALAGFPEAVTVSAAAVRAAAADLGTVLIVLDDDPTGTQSVADLPVLTRWERADFDWALAQGAPAVYVLTNTRSLDPDEAARRNREIVANADSVGRDPRRHPRLRQQERLDPPRALPARDRRHRADPRRGGGRASRRRRHRSRVSRRRPRDDRRHPLHAGKGRADPGG